MVYVLVPLTVAVAAALAWIWWSGRDARDPVSSISRFHRALDAMQPGGSGNDGEVTARPPS